MENSTLRWPAAGCVCPGNDFDVNILSLATRYLVVVLYMVTAVFGMCGNSLTIFVLVRHHHVRTVANCFILNLAVADNLFLVSQLFVAYSTYTKRWVFGDVACRFNQSKFIFQVIRNNYNIINVTALERLPEKHYAH